MNYTKPARIARPARACRRRGGLSVRAAERAQASAWLLWVYGMGMLAPLLYFAGRYPLRSHSQVRTDLGRIAEYGRGEFFAFVAGMLILFGYYLLALNETRRLPLRSALPPIFTCAAIFGAAMVWMYPVSATDVFHYAVRSRLLTTHGANPLVALAQDFPQDAWRPFASNQWARVASPYGPLWNLIAAPVTYLARDRMTFALVGFKALSLLSLLGVGWAIARSLAADGKAARSTGVLLFLWNPLVLWEAVGNAHNDVVMTLPLMLALLAWSARRDVLVIPLLVVAAAIKYVPILLIPLAAVACWRRAETWPARRRLVAWSIVGSAVVLLVAFYPFYDLQAVRTSVTSQGRIVRMSPVAVALRFFTPRFPGVDLRAWLRLVGMIILFGYLALQSFLVWRRPSHVARAMFEVLCIFLIVSTWYFNAWYLIWLVALAAVLPWGWASWRVIAWTASAMAGYGFTTWIQAWRDLDFPTVQAWGVALMFLPAALLIVAEAVAHGARRRPGAAVTSSRPIPHKAYILSDR